MIQVVIDFAVQLFLTPTLANCLHTGTCNHWPPVFPPGGRGGGNAGPVSVWCTLETQAPRTVLTILQSHAIQHAATGASHAPHEPNGRRLGLGHLDRGVGFV